MVKRPLCSGAKGRRFESCQAYQSKFCKGLHCPSISTTPCGAFAVQAKGRSFMGARFNFAPLPVVEARVSFCHGSTFLSRSPLSVVSRVRWTHILLLGGLLGAFVEARFHLDLKRAYPFATIADVASRKTAKALRQNANH